MDPSGALVANAKITVRSVATGAENVLSTNGSGNFVLPNVQPGRYSVRIESPGFRTETIENIQVDPSIGRRIDINRKDLSRHPKS